MKKGFTLSELLIVIALLSAVMVLIVPNLMETRKEMLKKSCNAKAIEIQNAAIEWGYDNIHDINLDESCTYVTVSKLISEKYLNSDSENSGVYDNPLTGESMINEKVCVKYKKISSDVRNRTIEATLDIVCE